MFKTALKLDNLPFFASETDKVISNYTGIKTINIKQKFFKKCKMEI